MNKLEQNNIKTIGIQRDKEQTETNPGFYLNDMSQRKMINRGKLLIKVAFRGRRLEKTFVKIFNEMEITLKLMTTDQ
jgi:hypothetical protein